MAISVLLRPGAVNYTRNKINYTFVCTGYALTQKVQVQLVDYNDNEITSFLFPITASSTNIFLDVAPILDVVVPEPGLPDPTNTGNFSVGGLYLFKVKYRIITPGTTPGSYAADGSYSHLAIKGGRGMLSPIDDLNFNYLGSNFFPYTGTNTPTPTGTGYFMTNMFTATRRDMHVNEYGWLLYLSRDTSSYLVVYGVNYKDGSYSFFSNILASSSYDTDKSLWYIPTGIAQCNLDPTGKGVTSYKVGIATSHQTIVEVTIDADYRPDYESVTLYYKNSFGAIENIRLKGARSQEANGKAQEYSILPTYLNYNSLGYGTNPYFDGSIRFKWTANTGFINRVTAVGLQEMLLKKGAWIINAGKFVPVRITGESIKILDTRDKLNNFQIEFETAGSFITLPKDIQSLP